MTFLTWKTRFQQQRLGGPLWKSEEGAAAVGYGGKCVNKYRNGGAVMSDDVQGGGSYGVALRER